MTILYAVKSYKSWRIIGDPSDVQDGETIMDSIPAPDTAQEFSDYCQKTADGVTSWLSSYVNHTFGYDDIVSASSYAGDKNPRFNSEGTAARDWRSDCFMALYAAMPSYSVMTPDQWPTLDYITSHLPQPSAYQWEPAS